MKAQKNTPPHRVPSFRLHKATGQGFVEIEGHRHYLGRHDRPETLQAYHRFISEWIANGRRLEVPPDEITVLELVDRYLEHCAVYYARSNGDEGVARLVEQNRRTRRTRPATETPTLEAPFGSPMTRRYGRKHFRDKFVLESLGVSRPVMRS